ncbi:LOW QUALITY PROTEIN: hypothetical protein ColTof3_02712 [Colletotrichum tofieldiae]|nr:LOW QUALITY PROTEIN: hypothetical protein ColTof3_02712 [Colletotrichum tofieldiae]
MAKAIRKGPPGTNQWQLQAKKAKRISSKVPKAQARAVQCRPTVTFAQPIIQATTDEGDPAGPILDTIPWCLSPGLTSCFWFAGPEAWARDGEDMSIGQGQTPSEPGLTSLTGLSLAVVRESQGGPWPALVLLRVPDPQRSRICLSHLVAPKFGSWISTAA